MSETPSIPEDMSLWGTDADPFLRNLRDPHDRERIRKGREKLKIATEQMLASEQQEINRINQEKSRLLDEGLRANEAWVRAAFAKKDPSKRKAYLDLLRKTALSVSPDMLPVIEDLEKEL